MMAYMSGLIFTLSNKLEYNCIFEVIDYISMMKMSKMEHSVTENLQV